MKKRIVMLLCLGLCLSLVGCKKSENPKTDFQYEISKDGTSVYINKYIGTSKNVVIPSKIDDLPVTSIKGIVDETGYVQEGAFEGCDIQSVTIPEGVTGIGLYAFKDCKDLTQVAIPESLEILTYGAFCNCERLKSIDLSATKLTALLALTFYDCVSLKKIALPSGITSIGAKAFYNCSSLLEIHLPEELVRMDDAAFSGCTALKTVTVNTKADLLSLSASAFSNVPALEKIIFEEGREQINGYAFFDTTSSIEIVIPKSVKKFSPEPFFLRGPAKITFLGDCPEIVGKSEFYGEPTIIYDPDTSGWDTCIWKDRYTLTPKK